MSKTQGEIDILADCVDGGDTVDNPDPEQLLQKWNIGGRRKDAGTAKN